ARAARAAAAARLSRASIAASSARGTEQAASSVKGLSTTSAELAMAPSRDSLAGPGDVPPTLCRARAPLVVWCAVGQGPGPWTRVQSPHARPGSALPCARDPARRGFAQADAHLRFRERCPG